MREPKPIDCDKFRITVGQKYELTINPEFQKTMNLEGNRYYAMHKLISSILDKHVHPYGFYTGYMEISCRHTFVDKNGDVPRWHYHGVVEFFDPIGFLNALYDHESSIAIWPLREGWLEYMKKYYPDVKQYTKYNRLPNPKIYNDTKAWRKQMKINRRLNRPKKPQIMEFLDEETT